MFSQIPKETIDISMVVLFNLYNFLLILMFYGRVNPKWRFGGIPAVASLWLGIPFFILPIINLLQQREWWTYVLPFILVGFIILEVVIDYILKLEFRQSWLVGPYLLIFFVSNMLMVGYAFLVRLALGFISLAIYFVMTAVSIYARMKTGL